MSEELKTWLIQRLNRPYERTERGDFLAKASEVFGGGSLQMSEDGKKVIRDAFSFDYMGAAEFEWGAVPNALQGLARDHKDLIAFPFPVSSSHIAPNYWRESIAWKERRKELDAAKKAGTKPPRKKKPKFGDIEDATLYVLCRDRHEAYVKKVILMCASDNIRLKESTCMKDALDPEPSANYRERLGGWFELDNGFFFFKDREMWERTCALFGVELPKEQ